MPSQPEDEDDYELQIKMAMEASLREVSETPPEEKKSGESPQVSKFQA